MEEMEKMSREIREIKEDVREIKSMLESSRLRHEEYAPTPEENRLLDEARKEIRDGKGVAEGRLNNGGRS